MKRLLFLLLAIPALLSAQSRFGHGTLTASKMLAIINPVIADSGLFVLDDADTVRTKLARDLKVPGLLVTGGAKIEGDVDVRGKMTLDTTPITKLTADSTVTLTGSRNEGGAWFKGNIGIKKSAAYNLDIYQKSPSANQVLFNVGTSDDANRFTVDEDGDVGIDGDLTVVGDIVVPILRNASGSIAIKGEDNVSFDIDWNKNDSDVMYFRWTKNNYETELARLKESGEFGLGTAAPGAKMEIAGTKSADTLLSVYNDVVGLTTRDSSFVVLADGSASTTGNFTAGSTFSSAYITNTGQLIKIGKYTGGTDNDVAVGYQSLQTGDDGYGVSVGTQAGRLNTGGNITFLGFTAGYSNTGDFTTLIGYDAGRYNGGNNATYSGAYSGWLACGDSASGYGYKALEKNQGDYATGVGYQSMRYNGGSNNTAIGAESFNSATANSAAEKTFDYTSIVVATNKIAIPGHGFTERINLIYTEGTSKLPGLATGTIYAFKVDDGDTLELLYPVLSAAGTGTGHKLTPIVEYSYTNSTAVGYDAEPTASNQVVLGNAAVTNILTYATTITRDSATSYITASNIADTGELTMATGVEGFGEVKIGAEYAHFHFESDGTVTLITNTANVGTTNDVDNKLNIYDGGDGIVIENQLGSTLKCLINITYMTP